MLCLPMLVVLSGAPELSAPRLSEYVDQCEEYVAHNITWHQVEDKCGCARSLGSKGIVPYLEWHYCDFGCSSASAALSFVLCGAWLLILFSTVASTADEYLVPNLERLSDTLQLSPNVAGVTLLALGNGAPDFFTSFASFT